MNIKNMTEVKIVMDEYGNLFAILPNGDVRKIHGAYVTTEPKYMETHITDR